MTTEKSGQANHAEGAVAHMPLNYSPTFRKKGNKPKRSLIAKSRAKSTYTALRIKCADKSSFNLLLSKANEKQSGGKIRGEQLFQLMLSLITDHHINLLQTGSLKNEDRKELLRQKYIELRGPISKDEFLGVMFSTEFPQFLKEHGEAANIHQQVTTDTV